MIQKWGRVLFFSLTVAQSASAEIDFKNLKDTHSFLQLKEECRNFAPENALNLIRGGRLNQGKGLGVSRTRGMEHPYTT